MGSGVGQDARLIKLQVQEQAEGSSGAPPDYKGRIALDLTLLDVERLQAALETGGFELANSRVHQNLALHHLGRSMHCSVILLCEVCRMVGSPYHPADLHEISWRDLQWVEIQRRGGADEVLVREEIIEDDAGVVSLVIVPTLALVPEDVMEGESDAEGSSSSVHL